MSSPSKKEFRVTKLYTPNGPRFTFTNTAGSESEAMMKVESAFGRANLRLHKFLDATSAEPVIHLQEVGMVDRQWEAYRGNSRSIRDQIFVAVNKSWVFPMGTQIEVFLRKSSDKKKPADLVVDGNSDDEQKPADLVVDGNSDDEQKPAGNSSDERKADFVVLGNFYLGGELTVSRGCGCVGNNIAQIKRVSSLLKFISGQGGENTYDVTVEPGEDQAFVLALTVILDQMYNSDSDLPCCNHQCQKKTP